MRIVSISTVIFEGYGLETAFAEIAAQGFKWAEPAYIKGYMQFSEDDFSEAAGRNIKSKMAKEGLDAVAISAHFDNGLPDAQPMLERRLRFASALGVKFIITNSTSEETRDRFFRNIDANLSLAQELGITIALENPGNGPTDMMRTAKMARDVIGHFGSAQLRLNYDVGNALTCSEGEVRPEDDLVHALDLSCHMHLKDMARETDRWRFTPIGQGVIDYKAVLKTLAAKTDCPLCLEMPLRLVRRFHENPGRDANTLSLHAIRSAIKASAVFVEENLSG
jgi:sugar phosphate isomerase/epimerase